MSNALDNSLSPRNGSSENIKISIYSCKDDFKRPKFIHPDNHKIFKIPLKLSQKLC